MEVHRELGCGFLEAVYRDALTLEFMDRAIPYVRESQLTVHYKERPLATSYRVDFICFAAVLVELKALPRLSATEEAQVLNYLKATRLETALLINFGASSLEWKRLIASGNWRSSAEDSSA